MPNVDISFVVNEETGQAGIETPEGVYYFPFDEAIGTAFSILQEADARGIDLEQRLMEFYQNGR